MKIRNKILVYFSSAIILVTGISLIIVFILFSEYREEEFQQQQYSKIKTTIGLIEEFDKISDQISLMLDKQSIHDFYDEKMLIYDNNKDLIFSSLDSLAIVKENNLLQNLSISTNWIETKEDGYDVIGVYIEKDSKSYYAISKAYDYFGYSKKYFLQKVLIGIFIFVVIIVILVSIYLSNIISKPIWELTHKIDKFDFSDKHIKPLKINTNTSELLHLSHKFNDLAKRTTEAFLFQKYSIQHISHELKTPLAVLVSELEKIQTYQNIQQIKLEVSQQCQSAKSLGNIINILLQISKIESGQEIPTKSIRLDELVFDCIAQLNSIYPDFTFDILFCSDIIQESNLIITANEELLKQALLNLMINAVEYADNQKAKIFFDCSPNNLQIDISNRGKTLTKQEQKLLFSYFFRGQNAKHKQGFGLGLILSQRIFSIYKMDIEYHCIDKSQNVFRIIFPKY